MLQNTDEGGSDQPSLDKLISLREAVELSGLSASYLRLLVSRGGALGGETGPESVGGEIGQVAHIEVE